MEEPVTITSCDEQIVGVWHPSASDLPAPAVALCHGFTGDKCEGHRIFVETARALAAQGVGVLRFDFRGSGDSGGDFVHMTVSGEVADAHAALAYLRGRNDVDENRVGLLGLSLGGLVAVLVAADDPAVRALALWNPVSNPVAVADQRRTEQSDQELQQQGFADYHGWAVGAPFLLELSTLDPLAAITKSTSPVLIVLGDSDESVPNEEGYAYQHAVEKATPHRDITLHVVQGGGHTFETLLHKKGAIETTVTWLVKQLCDHARDR